MATVSGPLMSMDASGSVGKTIVFSKFKGRNYVRQHAIPSNPETASQFAVRAMMRFLSQNWKNLTAAEKATWDSLAASANITPSNAFTKHNANRFSQFLMPLVDVAEPAGTAPVLGALTLTAGNGEFSFSQAITTPNDIWGLVVCMSTTTAFTPGRTNVRYVQYGIGGPITGVINKLLAGTTYYVRTAGFNRGGTVSAFIAEQNVTTNP